MTKQELIDKAVDLEILYPKNVMPGYYVNWDKLDLYEKNNNPQDELIGFIYGGGYKNIVSLTKEECKVVADAISIAVSEDIMDVNHNIVSIINKIVAEYPDLYLPNLPEINSINE